MKDSTFLYLMAIGFFILTAYCSYINESIAMSMSFSMSFILLFLGGHTAIAHEKEATE